MKLREIILDFTSLLDVIMIILFWFILNYRSQTARLQNEAKAAQEAALQTQAEAAAQMDEADELRRQAQDELDALAEGSPYQAALLEAVRDYRAGRTLNLTLVCRDKYWYVDIAIGDDPAERVYDDDAARIGLTVNEVLDAAGYVPEDAVFCLFSYNSEEPGSMDAYEAVEQSLKSLQLGNNRFSCTETDRAVPEE